MPPTTVFLNGFFGCFTKFNSALGWQLRVNVSVYMCALEEALMETPAYF